MRFEYVPNLFYCFHTSCKLGPAAFGGCDVEGVLGVVILPFCHAFGGCAQRGRLDQHKGEHKKFRLCLGAIWSSYCSFVGAYFFHYPLGIVQ